MTPEAPPCLVSETEGASLVRRTGVVRSGGGGATDGVAGSTVTAGDTEGRGAAGAVGASGDARWGSSTVIP